MTKTDWEELIAAYEMIKNSSINRLDAAMWTVYKVGNIIRIDIK